MFSLELSSGLPELVTLQPKLPHPHVFGKLVLLPLEPELALFQRGGPLEQLDPLLIEPVVQTRFLRLGPGLEPRDIVSIRQLVVLDLHRLTQRVPLELLDLLEVFLGLGVVVRWRSWLRLFRHGQAPSSSS